MSGRDSLKRRNWSEEEVDYLENSWGTFSIKSMAKNLNRTVTAIKQKAAKLGLGDPSLHYDGLTIGQLAKAIGVSYTTLAHWIKIHNFPYRQKIFVEELRVKVVSYADFWKWAEQHKQILDFSKIEKNILGPEPDWVQEKRTADHLRKMKIKKSNNHPWTEEEDNILKGMLNAYRHTYPEISQRLNRSEGAVKRRILDLGLKARPVRLNNAIKYTLEEVQMLMEMYDKGYCLETIAHRMNKSALGVRGKLERMGYKFKNGVPVKGGREPHEIRLWTKKIKSSS